MNERIKEINNRIRKKPKRNIKYKKGPEYKKFERKRKKLILSKSINYKKERLNIKKVSGNLRNELKNNIENKEKINIENFKNKVLDTTEKIIKKAGYNFDIKLLFKIGLMENMGGKGGKQELENALKKFSGENYKDLMKIKSNKGARGVFQIMPKTASGLNRIYKIQTLINNEKENLLKIGFKKEDFLVLENALQGAFMLIDTIKNHNLKSEYDIAGAYNMGPAGYKKASRNGRMPLETQNYIKKLKFINNNILNNNII